MVSCRSRYYTVVRHLVRGSRAVRPTCPPPSLSAYRSTPFHLTMDRTGGYEPANPAKPPSCHVTARPRSLSLGPCWECVQKSLHGHHVTLTRLQIFDRICGRSSAVLVRRCTARSVTLIRNDRCLGYVRSYRVSISLRRECFVSFSWYRAAGLRQRLPEQKRKSDGNLLVNSESIDVFCFPNFYFVVSELTLFL